MKTKFTSHFCIKCKVNYPDTNREIVKKRLYTSSTLCSYCFRKYITKVKMGAIPND